MLDFYNQTIRHEWLAQYSIRLTRVFQVAKEEKKVPHKRGARFSASRPENHLNPGYGSVNLEWPPGFDKNC